jgi:hypothetical protein
MDVHFDHESAVLLRGNDRLRRIHQWFHPAAGGDRDGVTEDGKTLLFNAYGQRLHLISGRRKRVYGRRRWCSQGLGPDLERSVSTPATRHHRSSSEVTLTPAQARLARSQMSMAQ